MTHTNLNCNRNFEPLHLEWIDNRTSNAQEERLSQLLLEHVAPSFASSVKLQALVVYQADDGPTNCLLVDRAYSRKPSADPSESSNAGLSDSGFADTLALSAGSPTGLKMSSYKLDSPQPSGQISRRKRKLNRPCKIPVNGEEEEVERCSPRSSDVSSPVARTSPPITTPSSLEDTKQQPTTNGLSESVFLPVSAVTLLPSLGVFSFPITVLPTLPRSILPRSSVETFNPIYSLTRSSASVVTTVPSSLVTSTPTLNTSTKHGDSKTTIPSNHDPSRRLGKSFVCNQCRKEFTSLNLLCAHTFAVHRGFRCTICRAQFTQRSNLQRHSLRHVGFKPFVCKICEKAYYRKDHLVRHIELAHPGCDPRANLTVKLSSAECLDYLDKVQHDGVNVEQAQLLYQAPSSQQQVATSSPANTSEQQTLLSEPSGLVTGS